MAGANLSIDITVDDRELRTLLQRLQTRLGDLKPAFADMGEHLLNSFRARFRSQTAPDGTPWAELSPGYQARKPKNKDKILTLSGHLRGLLAYRASKDELRVGTPKPYGAAMQFGAKKGQFGTGHYKTRAGTFPIPWGDIPPRLFLGLSADDKVKLVVILNGWLTRAMA